MEAKCFMLTNHWSERRGSNGDAGALAEANVVHIVLGALEQAGGLEVGGDGLAAVEAVHADIHSGNLCHGAVFVEDVDGVEVVGLAEHVVVLVVRRGHFEAAGAEVDVDVAVLNYGHHAAYQRHHNLAAAEPGVLGVLGIDAHGGVAHDSLGACGGHKRIVASGGVGMHHRSFGHVEALGFLGKVIAEVEEFRLLLDEVYLVVADCGAVLAVPVDHAEASVDKAFIVEVDEDFGDALAAEGIHGEGGTLPVAAGAELAELLQDDAAVFLGPVPGMAQELLAGEVGFLYTLGGELGYHLSFGGDACVVGSGHP